MIKVTMAERVARIEQKVEDMDRSMSEKLNRIDVKIDSFITCADRKFASKLTEKIVYALCGLVLTVFMTKLLGVW